MINNCPPSRHWCPQHRPADGVGMGPGYFCAAKDHAAASDVAGTPSCTRRKDHGGDHAGFKFGVQHVHTWAANA